MSRIAAIILIVPTLLLGLAGCWDPFKTKDKGEHRTPNGWKVRWQDQGTISGGLHTQAQLDQLFDAAMDRGIAGLTQWGIDPTYARSKLRDNDAEYTLVDNFYFKVEGQPADVPDAQYATGETFNRFEVTVAFYDRDDPGAVDPTQVPATSPSWTLKPSTTYPGKVYYGMEYDGRQYPALGYELHWQFTNAP